MSLVFVWDTCLEIWKCSTVQPFFKVHNTLAVSSNVCCNAFSYRSSSHFVASCIIAFHWDSDSVSMQRGRAFLLGQQNRNRKCPRGHLRSPSLLILALIRPEQLTAIWAWVYLSKRDLIRIQDLSVASRLRHSEICSNKMGVRGCMLSSQVSC
jgi:hypothetical protein